MPVSKISPNFYRKKISQQEIILGVKDDTLYGFLVVDLEPTQSAQKFIDVNWPPLFARDSIDFGMLSERMQIGQSDRSFPRTTLVQKMEEKEILLHSKLLQFYLENGFVVKKLHKFVEYQPGRCFSKFYDKLYELRVRATIDNNTAQATAIKLTGNSPYGKVSDFRVIPRLSCYSATFV